jgi:hypothetical protein
VSAGLAWRWRVLGAVPLALFALYFLNASGQERAWESLWVCHVANLFLGLGLVFSSEVLVRSAALVLVPAIPMWIYDMVASQSIDPISLATHLGGAAIAIAAVAKVGMRAGTWRFALAVGLAAQVLARAFSPPALNVNLAHQVYPGWETLFTSYAPYWVFVTLATAAVLWCAERLLLRFNRPALSSGGTPP